jgi:hypothetical protein
MSISGYTLFREGICLVRYYTMALDQDVSRDCTIYYVPVAWVSPYAYYRRPSPGHALAPPQTGCVVLMGLLLDQAQKPQKSLDTQ